MIDKIQQVAEQRRILAGLKAERDNLVKIFQSVNKSLFQGITDCETHLAETEASLRADALVEYNRTGNRKPAPGVEVKLFEVLTYDAMKAFAWAKEHQVALSLDKKLFESLAKSDGNRPDFVAVNQEPRSQIATDLDKALAEATKKGE